MATLVPPVLPAGTLAEQPQPRLISGELVLRPWLITDADVLVSAYSDPEIRRWHVRTMSIDEAQEWVGSREERWRHELGADWAATRDEAIVGRAGLRVVDLAEGSGELAYWVLPAARGRGVATAAVQAVTGWALETLGLHRLELRHSVANDASCRVAAKCGFALEGTLRSQLLHADGWHDVHLHARIG